MSATDRRAERERRYRAAEQRLWDALGVQPREHRVRLAGPGSTVRIQEVGSGEPVLLVHGGTTCGTSWADLAVRLPRRCLLLDRPGTGLSEPLPAPPRDIAGLSQLADCLVPEVAEALGLDGVDVVATSFGGYFAMRAAMREPASVRRLALVGWTAGAPTGALPVGLRLSFAPGVGGLLGRLPVGTRAVRSILRSIGLGPALDAGRIAPEAIEAYAALLSWTGTMRNDASLGRLFLSPRGVDRRVLFTRDQLARIQAPVELVWGERDPFGGVDIGRALAAGIPGARLQPLEGQGHAPWMDVPDTVAEIVESFLARPASDVR